MRAIALAVALVLSPLALAQPLDATENILAVYLDGKEVIPTAILQQSPDGDVWLDVEDWSKFPLALDLAGKEGLISARSLGLEPQFLAAEQAIDLKVPATSRQAQRFGRRVEPVTKANPQPKGVFLHYDAAGRVNDEGQWNASLGHEASMGVGPATLTTMGQLNHDKHGSNYHRSLTTLHYDHLPSGTAFELGDVWAPRSNLSGRVNLGGIRVGSDRQLRKHHNYMAVPTLGGVVEDASTAELYVNGRRTAQHSLNAGPWEVDHFPVQPGSNAVRVVVRDDFGREQVIEDRFYLSPNNLPQGTTEWEVAAGLVRGSGDDYTTPAVAANVERGMTDTWTLGAHVEATQDAQALTMSNRIVLGTAGILSTDIRGTQSDLGSGHAFAVSYDYRADDWGLNAGHTRYSDNHWTLTQERGGVYATARRLQESTSLSASYSPKGSNFSASLAATDLKYSDGSGRQRVDLGARYRNRDHSIGVGLGYTDHDGAMVWASYRKSLGPGRSFSVNARQSPDLRVDARMAGRNAIGNVPINWGAGVSHTSGGERIWGQATTTTPKGPLSVDIRHDANGTEASGRFESSVWIGEGGITTQGPGRGSSFLVVEVPGQAGVPVSAGGGFSSKTNDKGFAVVPRVHPLTRQSVRLDTRDMDMGVRIQDATQSAVARRRGGGKVEFEVLSERMVELRLSYQGEPIAPPAAARTDKERAVLGHGGIAVLMNAEPGQLLTVEGDGFSCQVALPAELPGFADTLDLECLP